LKKQSPSIAFGEKLWEPSVAYQKQSVLGRFKTALEAQEKCHFKNYSDLHEWSTQNLDRFWAFVAQFFEVDFKTPYTQVLQNGTSMLEAQWFLGARLSYAAHIFKKASPHRFALLYQAENEIQTPISWAALATRVAHFQSQFKQQGVQKGSVVAGLLNNHPDAVAAFLACNSLGAVWTCCAPEFGVGSITDRFKLLSPQILVAHSSSQYNGKTFDIRPKIKAIQEKLPELSASLILSEGFEDWDLNPTTFPSLTFETVSFSDPIWVLFSSGTTGKPKAITHSTGGILLEHYKALALHQDVQEGERFFWHTTTGWMMWNYALGALLCGASLCLFNGAAHFPDLTVQWKMAQHMQIHHFGHGAPFYALCKKENISYLNTHSWPHLKSIGSTGAPLTPDVFKWLQAQLPEVHIQSLSGGTDVCTAFVGANALSPVYAGAIQGPLLGAAVAAWNEQGQPLLDQMGELVLTKPLPSMPLYFWGDSQKKRYQDSYYNRFPNTWCHGDWITLNHEKGIVIHGRSDATLNRNGIRIGTAEIYEALEQLTQVHDSLVIDLLQPTGESVLLLFVALMPGIALTSALQETIIAQLKSHCSPRHVPDELFQVRAIPYTLSGKKMEVPIKKLFSGEALDKILQKGAMKNPESLLDFEKLEQQWSSI